MFCWINLKCQRKNRKHNCKSGRETIFYMWEWTEPQKRDDLYYYIVVFTFTQPGKQTCRIWLISHQFWHNSPILKSLKWESNITIIPQYTAQAPVLGHRPSWFMPFLINNFSIFIEKKKHHNNTYLYLFEHFSRDLKAHFDLKGYTICPFYNVSSHKTVTFIQELQNSLSLSPVWGIFKQHFCLPGFALFCVMVSVKTYCELVGMHFDYFW